MKPQKTYRSMFAGFARQVFEHRREKDSKWINSTFSGQQESESAKNGNFLRVECSFRADTSGGKDNAA
jgi:hypothetical protein